MEIIMYCVKNITKDLYWVGADDHRQPLFENIHPIPNGVSYNSYLLLDQKTVLFDTVDWAVCREFIQNIESVLQGRTLDYLVINHMEPDHGAAIEEILLRYPDVIVISSKMAFQFMEQLGISNQKNCEIIADGVSKCFGEHTVTFYAAPMVHWPEAMVAFDETDGVLFSADAFGSFGTLNGRIFSDEYDFENEYLDEYRRYYTNIVGKFGAQVGNLLKKAAGLPIQIICPLHGAVVRNNLELFIEKYEKWSLYEPEEDGVLIIYASMYGNTEQVAKTVASKLCEMNLGKIVLYDISAVNMSYLIAETFRFKHLILGSVTYNMDMFPLMHNLLMDMKALNIQNKEVAFIENGTWSCNAANQMKTVIETMKNMVAIEKKITIKSSILPSQTEQINDFTSHLKELWT